MNKTEAIKELQEKHDKAVGLLDNIPDGLDFDHFGNENVIFFGYMSFDRVLEIISGLRDYLGNYEISRYYISITGNLVVDYDFENYGITANFRCTDDPEELLKSVSNGKCSIKETTETSKEIICNA